MDYEEVPVGDRTYLQPKDLSQQSTLSLHLQLDLSTP